MEKLTTDAPQSNTEVLMNYAYTKDGRVVLRYGDQEDDIDLCEYMARMCRIKNCDPSAAEIMENGLECECPLSVLYSVSVQAAELRARLKMFEDIGLEPGEVRAQDDLFEYITAECGPSEAVERFQRLRELAQADREGRVVVLPCKVGDTIYKIPSDVNYELNKISGLMENNRVYAQTVCRAESYENGVYLLVTCGGMDAVHSAFYKKNWFLTREEAEKALGGGGDG